MSSTINPETGNIDLLGDGIPTFVINSDGTLTSSPTSGTIVIGLNLGHANTWTAGQMMGTTTKLQFRDTTMYIYSSSSGVMDIVGATTLNIGTAVTTLTCGANQDIKLGSSGNFVGFYGNAGSARQVLATGTGKTVDEVITVLQALNLVSQS